MLGKRLRLVRVAVLLLFAAYLLVNFLPAQAASAVTPIDTYTGPTLRLPWLSSPYGISQSYNCGDHSNNTKDQYAIDFGFGAGNQVQLTAVFAGTVHIPPFDGGGYGNSLWISNGPWHAVYAHLGTSATDTGIQVKPNQQVAQGQKIAMSGWTGNVRPLGPGGAHLHFSLRYKTSELNTQYDGDPVKPEPMSGYRGFGADDTCSTPSNSYNPAAYSVWLQATQHDYWTASAGQFIPFTAWALDNMNKGIDHVNFFLKFYVNGAWGSWSQVPAYQLGISNQSALGEQVDYTFAESVASMTRFEARVDVYSKNGTSRKFAGLLHYCQLTNFSFVCTSDLFPDHISGSNGNSGPPGYARSV